MEDPVAWKLLLFSAVAAATAATTCLCMTADSSPAQLRGDHGANSFDDVEGVRPGVADDSGSDGGGTGNNMDGGGGNESLCETFSPQRSGATGTRRPGGRKPGRQSAGSTNDPGEGTVKDGVDSTRSE